MTAYAKVVILGSPITKSNFKLHNSKGRAILPSNSGKYNDRYALYEQEIAYIARSQNPDVTLDESLIAILKVYYKSSKRHPDTINITKSIFDGIEKSGLIVNDSQIVKILTEEYYDSENPRFELELFGESSYSITYSVDKKQCIDDKKIYSRTSKNKLCQNIKESNRASYNTDNCSICHSKLTTNNFIKADNGKTLICNKCFHKLF